MAGKETRRGLGDNNPPGLALDEIDPEKLVDITMVVPLLRVHFKSFEDQRDELKAGVQRWIEAHTKDGAPRPEVQNDTDCGDTLDFLTQLREFATKQVEPARKRIKAPLDKAAKAVQSYFVDGLAGAVKEASEPIENAYSLFLIAKETRERDAKRKQAYDAQQEALRLADQARRARLPLQQDQLLEKAADAEFLAERMAKAAEAPAAVLTRVHGDMGSVGGLKTTWHWRAEALIELVQAVAQGRESIDMLTTNDSHINAIVRPADGRRKIPGLVVFSEQKGR